jgi:predicted secreted Zn-dependent protease
MSLRVHLTAALAICLLGVTWLLTRNGSEPPAGLIVETEFYDLRGPNPFLAARSRAPMPLSGDATGHFMGTTTWSLGHRFKTASVGGRCRVAAYAAQVEITYRMPRWVDAEAAPEAQRVLWETYLEALWAHERGHAAIVTEIAERHAADARLMEAVHCQGLAGSLGRRLAQVIEEAEAANADYDRTTSHGRTQGVAAQF